MVTKGSVTYTLKNVKLQLKPHSTPAFVYYLALYNNTHNAPIY